jgi:hypothetical protein
MAVETEELYSSPKGDRWFLGRDVATAEVFVKLSGLPSRRTRSTS